MTELLIHIGIMVFVYAILAASLDLLFGYTGIVSLTHAAFCAVGAYTAALLATKFGAPFLIGLVGGMAGGSLVSLLVSLPSLRLPSSYCLVTTFAFQVIVFSILNNWVAVTGGPMGLPGIPQPVILGWRVDQPWEFLILAGTCAALALWVCTHIVRSPVGRALKAIREDEGTAVAMGKNVFEFKVMVFVLGAALAGLAGVIYAHYVSFVDPTSFTVMESIFILSIVIIGGAGSLWGPVVGAVVLVSLPELLRFVGMPSSVAANVRQILYGGALVACMLWRPQGLMGEFSFRKNENP